MIIYDFSRLSHIEHALFGLLYMILFASSVLSAFVPTMTEPYAGLEVASAEHTQQSPELVDHGASAPERASLLSSPGIEKKWSRAVSHVT